MNYVILAMGATIIVLLMVLLIVLIKKSKKANSSEISCNQNHKSHECYNQNQDYKTEALGVNNRKDYKESSINLGEIPVLSQGVRTEALSAINRNKIKSTTEILGDGNKSNPNIGPTELLKTPKKVYVYAVLQYQENGYEKEFNITGNIINIGRDPEVCELTIPTDSFLGRNHAMIYMKDKKFFIVDLNSKNGTYVNGARIQGCMQIEDGITFKIASTEMKIKCCD